MPRQFKVNIIESEEGWKIKPCKKIRKNSIAGTLDPSTGYFRVGLAGKRYYVHRIIMIMLGKYIDDLEIDHVDGIRTNNLISNLRIITHAGNTRNRSKSTNNSSGLVGVYLNVKNRKNGTADKYWCAEWYDEDSNKHSRCFNTKLLGFDHAKDLAVQFRLSKIIEINRKLADLKYTNRHLNKE